MAFLSVAFVLFGSSARARAQEPYCVPGLYQPGVAALCVALEAPNASFEPPRLLQHGINLIAEVLAANSAKPPQDVLAASIDIEITKYLDEHRPELDPRGAEYCKALELKAKADQRFGAAMLATACLRPICLLSTPEDKPRQCGAMSTSNAPILLGYARQVGDEIFHEKCDKKQPDCQHVASDVAELVVLVDQLQPIFRAAFQSGLVTTCNGAVSCEEILTDFIRNGLHTLGKAAALDEALSNNPILGEKLDPGGKFQVAWQHLEQEKKSFSDPRTGRTFPWDIEFFSGLRLLRPEVEAVSARGSEYLKDAYYEELAAIWKRGEGLSEVIENNLALKSNIILREFAAAWAGNIHGRVGSELDMTQIVAAADAIRQIEEQLKQAEAELKNQLKEPQANLMFGGSPDSAARCSAGASKVDWVRGVLDFCFPDAAQKSWLTGLRFAFAPCQPGVHPCITTGDIRVLLPVQGAGANASWVAVPTGIGSVPAQVSETGITINNVAPVRPLIIKPEEVSTWLRRMLPPPLHVVDTPVIEVKDGPEIHLAGLRIALPISGLPDLELPSLTLSRTGLSVEGGSLSDAIDFETAVRRVLGLVVKRQSKIASLVVSSARLLENNELCGTATYRASENPYGFCITTQLGVGSVSLPLELEVLSPGFDPARVAPEINRALSSMLTQKFEVEAVTTDRGGVKISLQGPGIPPCSFSIHLDLAGEPIKTSDLLGRNPELLTCEAGKLQAETAVRAFSLLGLDFSEVREDRVCLPGGTGICIIGPKVSEDGSRVDFSSARLDDGGRLFGLIAERLNTVLPTIPASLSAVEIHDGRLLVEAEWNLPGFDAPIQVPIQLGKEQPVNFDVKSAVGQQIAAKLNGKSATWGALKLTIAGAEFKNSNELWVHGGVSFRSGHAGPILHWSGRSREVLGCSDPKRLRALVGV
jgi:hypothetical protein